MHVDRKRLNRERDWKKWMKREEDPFLRCSTRDQRQIRSRVETSQRKIDSKIARSMFHRYEAWNGREGRRKEASWTTSTLVKRLWNRWTWSTFPSIGRKTRPKTRRSRSRKLRNSIEWKQLFRGENSVSLCLSSILNSSLSLFLSARIIRRNLHGTRI